MADASVTNTFVSGTSIVAADMNQNFTDLVNFLNNRNSGATSWTKVVTTSDGTIGGNLAVTGNTAISGTLAVTGTSTLTGAVTANGAMEVVGAFTPTGGISGDISFAGAVTFTGGVANLFGYRRPNLVFVNTSTVDVENNTDTANQTSILFPDGTIRSVVENTAAAHKYRRFIITATAEYTTGTEDSGLHSGTTEDTNTWYAIYAVKSQIDSTKFILDGNLVMPVQANYATLDTAFGTNGWVYLGMIRNGDSQASTGDILSFVQAGPKTEFTNVYTASATGDTQYGIAVGDTTTTDMSWTVANGTGDLQVPAQILFLDWTSSTTSGATFITYFYNTAKSVKFGSQYMPGLAGQGVVSLFNDIPTSQGFMNSSSSTGKSIGIRGFTDGILSGSSPTR